MRGKMCMCKLEWGCECKGIKTGLVGCLLIIYEVNISLCVKNFDITYHRVLCAVCHWHRTNCLVGVISENENGYFLYCMLFEREREFLPFPLNTQMCGYGIRECCFLVVVVKVSLQVNVVIPRISEKNLRDNRTPIYTTKLFYEK